MHLPKIASGVSQDSDISHYAKIRISEIFKIDDSVVLSGHERFGFDLKPSFVSEFKNNELDEIMEDIIFVSDKQARVELRSGNLVIDTVENYCNFMIRMSKNRRNRVAKLLRHPIQT